MEWEERVAKTKDEIYPHLIKGGKVNWEYFNELKNEGRDEHSFRYKVAIGMLIDDMKVLTMRRRGFFATACGVFCNPRAPVLWGIQLYFANKRDCREYAEVEFKNAQYSWNITEMK
jgi:hypothetical protein